MGAVKRDGKRKGSERCGGFPVLGSAPNFCAQRAFFLTPLWSLPSKPAYLDRSGLDSAHRPLILSPLVPLNGKRGASGASGKREKTEQYADLFGQRTVHVRAYRYRLRFGKWEHVRSHRRRPPRR